MKSWTKNIHILLVGFLCGAMVMSFQNCADSLNLGSQQQNLSNSSPHPDAPVVNNALTELSASQNSPLTITIQATGENLTYSWLKDGQALPDTGASISFNSVQPTDAGVYSVTVSNENGSATFDITLNVVTGSASGAPTITAPVVNALAFVINGVPTNANISFNVVASGQALQYQWYRVDNIGAETAIAGANAATYNFLFNNINLGGIYRVRVSNASGSAMSEGTLTVQIVDVPIGEGGIF